MLVATRCTDALSVTMIFNLPLAIIKVLLNYIIALIDVYFVFYNLDTPNK